MQAMNEALFEIQQRMKRLSQEEKSAVSIDEKKYQCRKCKDEEGYIVRNDNGIEVWKFCECRDKKRIQRLMKASQITDEFKKKSFSNFRCEGRPALIQDAYETVVEYWEAIPEIKDSRKNSIALLGIPGCGKTHLLMAVSNNLLDNGHGVLYFPWVEGFNDLKADFDLAEEKIRRMQSVEFLFIDDLFKGRKEPTDYQREQLFAVVNYRYLNNKPILISSEWDFDQICRFDMGVGSRLYEMCKDFAVQIKGGKELNYRLSVS